MMFAVIDAIRAGHVAACQDISDGGLAVAISEMALGGFAQGKLGAKLALTAGQMVLPAGPEGEERFLRPDKWLFSESSGFLMEAVPGREAALQELFGRYNLTLMRLGEVTAEPGLEITLDGERLLKVSLEQMRESWLGGLERVLR